MQLHAVENNEDVKTNLRFKTDQTTCVNCYANKYVHCIKENMIDSECGTFEEGSEQLKTWMVGFKYCT